MRFLVGVLYTIESEFEKCIASINAQKEVEVELFIIRNKSKKEAHDLLYTTFMDFSPRFDFFVKVDADMILEDGFLFKRISELFKMLPSKKMLTIPVWDYFTESLINGMHFWRSNAKWRNREKNNEVVFTDDQEISSDEALIFKEFGRVVTHCTEASSFQSFHYGLHRGVKLYHGASIKNKKRNGQKIFHLTNLLIIYKKWKGNNRNNRNRAHALFGSIAVFRNMLDVNDIPYNNPRARSVFNTLQPIFNDERKRSKFIRLGFIVLWLKRPKLMLRTRLHILFKYLRKVKV